MKRIAVDPSHLALIASRSLSVRGMTADGGTLGLFMQAREYDPGEVLIAQGSTPTELMFVVEGEVAARAQAESALTGRASQALDLNRLGALDILGEVSMITRLPAIATLTAATRVQVLVLRHADVDALLKAFPAAGMALLRRLAENVVEKIIRTDGPSPELAPSLVHELRVGSPTSVAQQSVIDHLRTVRAFAWPDAELTPAVAALFKQINVEPGQKFIEQGSSADSMFLLAQGTARVDGADGPLRGYTGHHERCEHVVLGEMSFLTGAPRGARVSAVTYCTLLELPAEALPLLVTESPAFAERLLRGVLHAVCRKLVDTSSMRARFEAVVGGDLEMWFMDDSEFPLKFGE